MDLSSGISLEQWEKVVAQHHAIYPPTGRSWEYGLTIRLKNLLVPAIIEVFISIDFYDIDTSRYFQPEKIPLTKEELSLRQAPVLDSLYGEFQNELGQVIESYWLATMQLPIVGDSLHAFTLIGTARNSTEDVDTQEVTSDFIVTSREISLPGRRDCTTCIYYRLTEKE